jgi:hypothetical protein
MISRGVALLFGAFALAGCCVTGQGCYAPVLTAPFAFEPSASDADLDAPRKKVAHTPQTNGVPNGTAAQRNAMAQDGGKWEEEQAADREADAKLSSQLKICRGC